MKAKSIMVDEESYICIQKEVARRRGRVFDEKREDYLRRSFRQVHSSWKMDIMDWSFDIPIVELKKLLDENNLPYEESEIEYMFL